MQRAFHKVSIPVGTCQDVFRQLNGKDEMSVMIPWVTWGGTMLMSRGYMHSVWSLSFQTWSKPEISSKSSPFSLYQVGLFFLWARDSNERQFTGCMISHTMAKNWDKTTIWLSSAEKVTSASNSCSTSLRPHWHWFTSIFGMHGLYIFLIVNSILLDSGRGVTTGHAREGMDELGGLTGLVSHISCND